MFKQACQMMDSAALDEIGDRLAERRRELLAES